MPPRQGTAPIICLDTVITLSSDWLSNSASLSGLETAANSAFVSPSRERVTKEYTAPSNRVANLRAWARRNDSTYSST